jgi:hypothetical protein
MISRLLFPSVVRRETYSLVRWSRAIRATQQGGIEHGRRIFSCGFRGRPRRQDTSLSPLKLSNVYISDTVCNVSHSGTHKG